MSELVFHVGYPKTATTWLQRKVFTNLPLNYIGRHYEQVTVSRKGTVVEKLKFADHPWIQTYIPKLGFDDLSEVELREAQAALKPLIRPDQVNLISHEKLCRPFFSHQTAQLLAQVGAGHTVKVILSIREQRRIITSRYCHDVQLIKSHYPLRNALEFEDKDFCDYPKCTKRDRPCPCEQKNAKTILLSYYNYWQLYQSYVQALGAENVFVLVFERLFDATQDEFERLLNFLGLTLRVQDIQTLRDQPADNERSPVDKAQLMALNQPGLDALLQEIHAYYLASNLCLEQALSLGLGQYGYLDDHSPSVKKSSTINSSSWLQRLAQKVPKLSLFNSKISFNE